MPPDVDPDIDELFPDLANVLRQWQPANQDPANLTAPEGSNVSVEEFEAFAAKNPPPVQQFGTTHAPPPAGGVEDSPDLGGPAAPPLSGESATNPPPAPPVAPTDPGPGTPALDSARLAQLTQLQQIVSEDEQLRDLIAEHLSRKALGTPPTPPAPAPAQLPPEVAPQQTAQGYAPPQPPPLTPPDDLDMDDPAIKALWDLHVAQSQQLGQLQGFVQAQTNAQQAQVQTQMQSLARQAQSKFAEDHSLTQAEVDTLSQVAARLNVLPGLMQGIDPTTGLPSAPDPLVAVDRALEIAMYSVPEYRAKELTRIATAQRADRDRKQKLGAVSGSSGSVPRSTPQPTNPQETRANLHREVADMLRGEWSEPANN